MMINSGPVERPNQRTTRRITTASRSATAE
jgi:hypothetical protein